MLLKPQHMTCQPRCHLQAVWLAVYKQFIHAMAAIDSGAPHVACCACFCCCIFAGWVVAAAPGAWAALPACIFLACGTHTAIKSSLCALPNLSPLFSPPFAPALSRILLPACAVLDL